MLLSALGEVFLPKKGKIVISIVKSTKNLIFKNSNYVYTQMSVESKLNIAQRSVIFANIYKFFNGPNIYNNAKVACLPL